MRTEAAARYRTRLAEDATDLAATFALRGLAFHGNAARGDEDGFDASCAHVLIEDVASGRLVGCFRRMDFASGAEIGRSYSAHFYDLDRLRAFDGPMVEMGRFCVHPGTRDPDVVRVAWAAMTAHVDANGTRMLFGCTSFPGTDAAPFRDAFALLRARHLAPERWRPRARDWPVYDYLHDIGDTPDPRRAMAAMPPLLRTYLAMGGWVSDHAVIDRCLGTLHVFTAVEIASVPPARARLLRALAGRTKAADRS